VPVVNVFDSNETEQSSGVDTHIGMKKSGEWELELQVRITKREMRKHFHPDLHNADDPTSRPHVSERQANVLVCGLLVVRRLSRSRARQG